jgi:ABC-type sugar transport system substrate-binding protein
VVGLAGVGLTACGSGDSTTGASVTTAQGTSGAAGKSLEEAKAAIAPYIGKPGPFAVYQKLKSVPRGSHVIFVNCGQPDCQLIYESLQEPAKALGINLTQVVAGSNVQGITSAFNTAVQEKPSAVIDAALDPALWKNQLAEFASAGIPVIGVELSVDAGNGVTAVLVGPQANAQVGRLQADYIYAQSEEDTNAVFVEVPEFVAFKGQQQAFADEMGKLCPSCSTATTSVTAASVGTSAPTDIVSYLQANPDTNWVVLPFDTVGQGLPQALGAAGIDVQIIGAAPTPTTLEYIKEGKETVSMGSSQSFLAWMTMDATARSIVGQKLGRAEAFGQPPRQFLVQEDITFDPQEGWTPYPEYKERFEKLWGVR